MDYRDTMALYLTVMLSRFDTFDASEENHGLPDICCLKWLLSLSENRGVIWVEDTQTARLITAYCTSCAHLVHPASAAIRIGWGGPNRPNSTLFPFSKRRPSWPQKN